LSFHITKSQSFPKQFIYNTKVSLPSFHPSNNLPCIEAKDNIGRDDGAAHIGLRRSVTKITSSCPAVVTRRPSRCVRLTKFRAWASEKTEKEKPWWWYKGCFTSDSSSKAHPKA
jgi:hypothetical protein